MLNTVALIPVKPVEASKSRLRGALPDLLRFAVCRELVMQTIFAAKNADAISEVHLAVRGDMSYLDDAMNGIDVIWHDDEDLTLAENLTDATSSILGSGADKVLILPTDLPYINPQAISCLVRKSDSDLCVALSPSDAGTSAMMISSSLCLPLHYEKALSGLIHIQSARAQGLSVEQISDFDLRCDLDCARDLGTLDPRRCGPALSAAISLFSNCDPTIERRKVI